MPTGQKAPNQERRDVPGGSQDVAPTGGVTARGGSVERSGGLGHDSSQRCGECGLGYALPEELQRHLREAHRHSARLMKAPWTAPPEGHHSTQTS